MAVRILNKKQVVELLPMREAIALMRRAFGDLSAGRVVMPHRGRIDVERGNLLLKPAAIEGDGLYVKLVSTFPANAQQGMPSVQGLMMVFDVDTGEPRAVMDAAELTAIRTGAGGGLAVDLLARRNSKTVALIGAGAQSRTQLLAAVEVRPIERVYLFDPNTEAAEKLQAGLNTSHPEIEVELVGASDEGVAEADIVLTATTSPVPTFSGSAVRPGTHINAIGAYTPDKREVDEQTVRMAYIAVDSYESAKTEAGDLVIPGVAADAELGEIVNGDKPGRTDDQQVTLFKSVGVAVQDAAAAGFIYRQAEQRHIGIAVDLDAG